MGSQNQIMIIFNSWQNSEASASFTASSEIKDVQVVLWVKGKIASLTINFSPVKELPTGSYDSIRIGNVPENFAPQNDMHVIFVAQASNQIFNGLLYKSGKLDLWVWGGMAVSSSMNLSCYHCYIIK